jgi:AcrR family transcriptional regulator
MTPVSRREEHKELTRRAVLDAAAVQFAQLGFAETPIDAVARAARVSKGAVYYHFADKAALFEAVFRDRQERLLGRVAGVAGRRGDPWDRLDAVLAAYLEGTVSDATQCALLRQAQAALGSGRCREIDGELAVSIVAEILEGAERTGRLRPETGELLARVLLAAAREAALTAAESPARSVARREAGSVLASLTAGLRRPLRRSIDD